MYEDDELQTQLEFAAREYEVTTNHLIKVLERVAAEKGEEGVSPRIKQALFEVANAINEEWS